MTRGTKKGIEAANRGAVAGADLGSGHVFRARVQCARDDGSIVVVSPQEGLEFRCEVLETGLTAALVLHPGDDVLVWKGGSAKDMCVVLGRVGFRAGVTGAPDRLLIEAKDGLTLRVGDGSITLRSDGKILIKGKDLVSHAKRMNRIKGGAVSIN
jgi:hypothetical protein